MNPERLARLQADLLELSNDPKVSAALRDDVLVTLSTLDQHMPPPDPDEPAVVTRSAEAAAAAQQDPASAVQRPPGTWMSGEVAPAQEGAPGLPAGKDARDQRPENAPAPAGNTLDVAVRPAPTGDGYEVDPKRPDQALAARTVRELLNATVGRQLTPLGDGALSLVTAVERNHLQMLRYVALVESGRPLLLAAVDFQTPAGQQVAAWFNEVLSWQT